MLASEQAVAAVANDYEPGRFLIVQGEREDELYAANQQLFSLLQSNTQIDASSLSSFVQLGAFATAASTELSIATSPI